MTWVNAVIQGVMLGGLYALFACGLSLMFGVMKVINLAHGDLAVVAAYLALGVVAITHVPTVWSFVLVVPIFGVLGYVLQRTLLQSALNRSVLTTLLVTFGLSVVIENGLQQFLSANSKSLNIGSLVSDSFSIGSQITIAYLDLVILAVAVVILLGLQYFLSASRNGRLIRAVADDREAAQLSGIDYRHVFASSASPRRSHSAPWRWLALRSGCTPSSTPRPAVRSCCCTHSRQSSSAGSAHCGAPWRAGSC
jgi:branched-chain amino acid transport system permease protein